MTIQRFSASVVGRHMSCHASANLEVAIPGWEPPIEDPKADNAANRGTMMHAEFAAIMQHSTKDIINMGESVLYVADIMSRRRYKKLVEKPEVADWLDTKPGTTADLVLYVQDEMHVFDLKTGTIPVEPVENPQLLFYAATYGKYAPRAQGVTVHIVQPRAGIMDSWYITADRLKEFMDEARQTEADIQSGSLQFGPSDFCKFCPANPHGRGARGTPSCPSMLQMLYPQSTTTDDDIMEGDL